MAAQLKELTLELAAGAVNREIRPRPQAEHVRLAKGAAQHLRRNGLPQVRDRQGR